MLKKNSIDTRDYSEKKLKTKYCKLFKGERKKRTWKNYIARQMNKTNL